MLRGFFMSQPAWSLVWILASWTVLGGVAAAADEPAPAPKAPVVSVRKLAPVELSDEIGYPARTFATAQATVTATIDGVVLHVAKTLGQAAQRGETLVTLKNDDPAYQFLPVKTPSPIGGLVSAVLVSDGATVRKGDQLVTVVDPASVRLVVELAASDLARVPPGLDGEFTTRGEGGAKARVRVLGVSPLIDPATGTATAELIASPGGKPLPIGLVGRVTFKVGQRNGLTVPENALTYRGDETLVKVVENGVAHLKPVQVAGTRRGEAELKAGVKAGDQVIVRASTFVADGQAVTVQETVAKQ
jgi:multidrug efflux pump subunit AcrA (membrane-fusion protein)